MSDVLAFKIFVHRDGRSVGDVRRLSLGRDRATLEALLECVRRMVPDAEAAPHGVALLALPSRTRVTSTATLRALASGGSPVRLALELNPQDVAAPSPFPPRPAGFGSVATAAAASSVRTGGSPEKPGLLRRIAESLGVVPPAGLPVEITRGVPPLEAIRRALEDANLALCEKGGGSSSGDERVHSSDPFRWARVSGNTLEAMSSLPDDSPEAATVVCSITLDDLAEHGVWYLFVATTSPSSWSVPSSPVAPSQYPTTFIVERSEIRSADGLLGVRRQTIALEAFPSGVVAAVLNVPCEELAERREAATVEVVAGLVEMGFEDVNLNRRILAKHTSNIDAVIAELLETPK
jgi:hypothetical protein